MPTIRETKIYQFNELDDAVKDRARDWFRSCQDANDYDAVIEDAVRMGEMLGIEFGTHRVPLMNGSTRHEPNIYWSGSSQGDGACFEGRYSYRPGALKALQKEAPATWKDPTTGETWESKSNKELHRIAKALQEAQRPYFYQLTARVKHTGHYYHSHSVTVDVEHAEDSYRDVSTADEVEEALRDFCDWIYSQLKAEDDYINSDEYVDEAIEANEYEFYENGERA